MPALVQARFCCFCGCTNNLIMLGSKGKIQDCQSLDVIINLTGEVCATKGKTTLESHRSEVIHSVPQLMMDSTYHKLFLITIKSVFKCLNPFPSTMPCFSSIVFPVVRLNIQRPIRVQLILYMIGSINLI